MAKVTRCVPKRCQHKEARALWILTLLVLWCARVSLVDINLACFVVSPGWPLHITLHHGGLFSLFTSIDVISHSLADGYLVLLRA